MLSGGPGRASMRDAQECCAALPEMLPACCRLRDDVHPQVDAQFCCATEYVHPVTAMDSSPFCCGLATDREAFVALMQDAAEG